MSTAIIFCELFFPVWLFLFIYFDSCHSGLKLAWSSPLLRGLSSLPLLLNHLSLVIQLQRLWLCRLFLHMVSYPHWHKLFFQIKLHLCYWICKYLQALQLTCKLNKIKVSNKIDTQNKWLKYVSAFNFCCFFHCIHVIMDVIWPFLRCLCQDWCICWPREVLCDDSFLES